MILILVIGVVGGTLACLTDKTETVTNTFTVGDINIDLQETWNTDTDNDRINDAWKGKMVPGTTLAKDPKVTVEAGSEACWLFVKVEKSTNLDSFISYSIADGWFPLVDTDNDSIADNGVYYRIVPATIDNKVDGDGATISEAVAFDVLANNNVTVKGTVTKGMMESLKAEGATQPTLTFTAYAVQSDNLTDQNSDTKVDAQDAWILASK